MRKSNRKRSSSNTKRQPQASKVSDRSVEVTDVVLDNSSVTIHFGNTVDAQAFYAEFKLQLEVDTFLDDMPADEYADGVLRTLKVKR